MMFLAQDERQQKLQQWMAAGIVKMISFPALRPNQPMLVASTATYVVKGETFVDDDPIMFPSPEFMARLILAVEFAPSPDDPGDWR